MLHMHDEHLLCRPIFGGHWVGPVIQSDLEYDHSRHMEWNYSNMDGRPS